MTVAIVVYKGLIPVVGRILTCILSDAYNLAVYVEIKKPPCNEDG